MTELESAQRQIQAVHSLHYPYGASVHTNFHWENEHVSEDERCAEQCFEGIFLCNGCGTHFPCTTIRLMEEAKCQ